MYIFVSAPYSANTDAVKSARVATINDYCVKLIMDGYAVISPVSFGVPLISHAKTRNIELRDDWQYWNKYCLEFISKAGEVHVLTLEGWSSSEGVLEEISMARDCDITIKYITGFDDEKL